MDVEVLICTRLQLTVKKDQNVYKFPFYSYKKNIQYISMAELFKLSTKQENPASCQPRIYFLSKK